METLDGVYVSFLYIISDEDKNKLPLFIIIYLEDKYSHQDYREFVKRSDPIDILVVTKYLPSHQAVCPTWDCDSCTMGNKFFMAYCTVCGLNRPVGYVEPTRYYLNTQDKADWDAERARELKVIKDTEDAKKKRQSEKAKNRRRLEEVLRQDLILTTEKTECPICLSELKIGEGVVLHSCTHVFCRDCLKNEIMVNNKPKVTCPTGECFGIVDDREKAALLNAQELSKYQELSMKSVEATLENTFHCKTENCPYFVINELVEPDRLQITQFMCTICRKINCLNCGVIHENQTCAEYQNNPNAAMQKDLDALQQEIAYGLAQKCPGCGVIIKKRGGCRHMKCNNCKRDFQWTGRDT